mgnify:CR=1 FL=1
MAPRGVFLLFLLFVAVDSRPTYRQKIPNGDQTIDGSSAMGHVSTTGGGARNDFGKAFAAASHTWTTELCQGDADGDGLSNGLELGDECCQWTDGAAPVTSDLSHPGKSGSKTSRAKNDNCPDPKTPSSGVMWSPKAVVTAIPLLLCSYFLSR